MNKKKPKPDRIAPIPSGSGFKMVPIRLDRRKPPIKETYKVIRSKRPKERDRKIRLINSLKENIMLNLEIRENLRTLTIQLTQMNIRLDKLEENILKERLKTYRLNTSELGIIDTLNSRVHELENKAIKNEDAGMLAVELVEPSPEIKFAGTIKSPPSKPKKKIKIPITEEFYRLKD